MGDFPILVCARSVCVCGSAVCSFGAREELDAGSGVGGLRLRVVVGIVGALPL